MKVVDVAPLTTAHNDVTHECPALASTVVGDPEIRCIC